jgi:hypothetical protein
MPAIPVNCIFGTTRHRWRPKHEHAYAIGRFGARRCTCGSRTFKVICGGPAEPVVKCDRCERTNITATAFEAGRQEGIRPEVNPHAPAPF